MISHILGLKCLICGKSYSSDEIEYICPDHGDEGLLEVVYDYDVVADGFKREELTRCPDFSIWRYKPLLPVSPETPVPPLHIGYTPLYSNPRLARQFDLDAVWIKDDGRLPTASFKDRASAVAVMKAHEKNASVITTASTGNAAAALSGICAAVGKPNVIFVPETAPKAKIAQLLVYGSTVMLVRGTYDDAFELCLAASRKYGWYNRNTGYNPYMSEGKKTAAYEICEQLCWQAPDRVFVSVGDGCIIGGLHKGFKDLLSLGWIDRMPRLMGVQAEGSAYLYDAWQNDEDVTQKAAIAPDTLADSISAGLPRDRIKAMAAVKETEGAFVRVSDIEILTAITDLARSSGVFAEPAGAAAFSGLRKAFEKGQLQTGETTVVISTGSGLKDIDNAMAAVHRDGATAHHLEPSLSALDKVISATCKL